MGQKQNGSPGSKGDKGDKGDSGDRGLKGDKGDKGDSGEKGVKGDLGDTGDKGAKGDKGDKGDTGDKGAKGDTGAVGPQGIQGPKGDKGEIDAINEQTPTYTVASDLEDLSSGEKVSTAFGKIAKAVNILIGHMATKASESAMGHVKLSRSSSITEAGVYAMDAVEKNPKVSGTLASQIAEQNTKLGIRDITFSTVSGMTIYSAYSIPAIKMAFVSGFIPAGSLGVAFSFVSLNGCTAARDVQAPISSYGGIDGEIGIGRNTNLILASIRENTGGGRFFIAFPYN